jgi:rRNA maturation endonuclease Nob1
MSQVDIVDYIHEQAEKISYERNLPNREAIMFMRDELYQTGSDYPKEELSRTIQEIQEDDFCMNCRGTGRIMTNVEDPNQDICDICDGNGNIYDDR